MELLNLRVINQSYVTVTIGGDVSKCCYAILTLNLRLIAKTNVEIEELYGKQTHDIVQGLKHKKNKKTEDITVNPVEQ